MLRTIAALAEQEFDLLIIGAGIHGACAAREAAIRGLRVALVDRGDFCSGTSANSLKIVHGGLRYLQQADLPRMRQSIRERREFLRLAPHLVHTLPCILPTYGLATKSLPALGVALLVNDIISFDRNRGIPDRRRHLPRGRLVSRDRCLQLLPDLDPHRVTGGAIWHDAQMYNPERLAFSFVLGAVEAGAVAVNHVAVESLRHDGRRVTGAALRDEIGGTTFSVRARLVLNCAGAAVEELLANSGLATSERRFIPSTAMNLVINRPLTGELAAGLHNRFSYGERRGSRVFFFTPWRGISVVGTRHLPLGDGPNARFVTEDKIESFLSEINATLPGAKIRREEVTSWNWGIIPMEGINPRSGEVSLVRHSHVVDHRTDGIEGLLSVIGVKYTTGRQVAEAAVRRACALLGRSAAVSAARMPLPGGAVEDMEELRREIAAALPAAPPKTIVHLARTYGSRWREMKALTNDRPELAALLPGNEEVIAAEALFAAREEAAVTLADFVLRRTGLGTTGKPSRETLTRAADLMGSELGWDAARRMREVAAHEAIDRVRG
jgi:glycerol-3-phosphate dehydrogenase